jgi:AcrR family transcriptional regulator
MPKLSEKAVERKRERIEDGAKQLFIRQGFHATSMRNIAARAGTSLGNLYNYYPTKEAILGSIISKYQKVIDERLKSIFDQITEPLSAEGLTRFARLVKQMVNDHHDFWLLMYIDVLEFENLHFRKMFENLTHNLRRRFAKSFQDLQRSGALHAGVDPAIGFTAAYMQFFNYFIVEKLFGGDQHFGISDEQVISRLTDIYSRGLLRATNHRPSATKTKQKVKTSLRGQKRTSR